MVIQCSENLEYTVQMMEQSKEKQRGDANNKQESVVKRVLETRTVARDRPGNCKNAVFHTGLDL
jgi:hypothetical protein